MHQIFLLSPARCDGERARILLNRDAEFDLARRIRADGAPIGEVFSFLSGLYFRGKLAYARAFGSSAAGPTAYVITANRGLVPPETVVQRRNLVSFSRIDIAKAGARHRVPLRRDVEQLAAKLDASNRVILLGSIATGKYADMLVDVFGDRVLFPTEFVGRGDMSRGGLLLRQVRAGEELEYAPIAGAIRHGKRPPRLTRITSAV
ncbi:MAG TPA: hypothetical protein VL383_14780 [Gemmatimonadaceae bacterium]|jgi:hypothetical protein|nr:hypothetical protein [Gemmatimonadaceae bacterium]